MNIGATGGAGEDAALEAYLKKGFVLVARNYQTRYGEIDLIVKNDKYLVFVEVKTRTPRSRMSGVTAMTRAKKQKIFKSALLYIQAVNFKYELQPRFDMVDIAGHWTIFDQKEIFITDKLTVYEGAFGSEVYDGFI